MGIPRIGIWAWSFVGVVAATIIVVAALAAVSEIVLPLTFAVVLAVVFQPAVGILVHHRFKPAIAAGLVVVGLLAPTGLKGRGRTLTGRRCRGPVTGQSPGYVRSPGSR
jgi:predicted PurR-regulated permease PerM